MDEFGPLGGGGDTVSIVRVLEPAMKGPRISVGNGITKVYSYHLFMGDGLGRISLTITNENKN